MKTGPKTKYTTEYLKELYDSGKNCPEIANITGSTKGTIYKRLKRINCKFRPASVTTNTLLNHNYFSPNTITNEVSYWIGFLTGDGSLFNRGFSLGLSLCDEQHIRKLANLLNFVGKFTYRPPQENIIQGKKAFSTGYAQMKVCSLSIRKDLEYYGLLENKSIVGGTLNIPIKNFSAFLLGIIDADGWILKRNFGIGLRGHPTHMEYIKQKIFEVYSIKLNLQGDQTLPTISTTNKNYLNIIVPQLLNSVEYSLPRKRVILEQGLEGIKKV